MFDPAAVKEKCNGMLSPAVYGRIYELAKNAPGESFIEVGAAHGAATICLGSALRDSCRAGKVYSFEKITGGSRERFGSFDTNKRIIEENIAFFGLGDRIVMNYGLVEDLATVIPERADFGLLMLDADGRIDRDFSLFFDKLADNAVMIIDDVAPQVRVKTASGSLNARRVFVDQKHRLSNLLVDFFTRQGMIEGAMLEGTWVGKKSGDHFDPKLWSSIVEQYRELVFADAPYEVVPGGFRGMLARQAKRVLPGPIVQRLRRFKSQHSVA